MNTATQSKEDGKFRAWMALGDTSMLHYALRANDYFSGIVGLIFIFWAQPLANYMGVPSSMALILIGIGLVGWSYLLFQQSRKTKINKTFAGMAIEADLIWVAASVALLLWGGLPLTTAGKWLIGISADVVLGFAVWQYFGLRKQ